MDGARGVQSRDDFAAAALAAMLMGRPVRRRAAPLPVEPPEPAVSPAAPFAPIGALPADLAEAALDGDMPPSVVPAGRLVPQVDAPALSAGYSAARHPYVPGAVPVVPAEPMHRHTRETEAISYVRGNKVVTARCACGWEWTA